MVTFCENSVLQCFNASTIERKSPHRSPTSVLRANAQKYREKGGHSQNLTNLCFEFNGINEFSKVFGFFFLNTAFLKEYLGK